MEKEYKRIYWIDSAKIIAMILVMTTHTIAYSEHLGTLYKYISSFHVPLFFLISGLTFNISKYYNYKEFFLKKFKTIVIPYLIWAILFLIPYIVLGNNVAESLDVNVGTSGIKQIIGIFYGNGHEGYLKQNTSLWFLTCLFTLENIYYFIEKSKNKNKYYIAMLISIILGLLDYYFLPIRLPWGLDIAIVMVLFFTIGRLIINQSKTKKKRVTDTKKFLLAIACIIVGYFIQSLNTNVGCVNREFGNYLLFIISAIFSVIGYIFIIIMLPYNKVIQYAGMRTLAILIFHKVPVLLFQTKLGRITMLLKDSNMIIELLFSIVIIGISIIFSLLTEKVIMKICPIMLGNNLKRKEKYDE